MQSGLALPQASTACAETELVEFTGNEVPEGGIEVTVTLLQESVAVIVQVTMVFEAQVYTTMLLGQIIVGGLVSTTITVCEQVLLLPHRSVASHVCVAVSVQPVMLVVGVSTVIVTFDSAPHASITPG